MKDPPTPGRTEIRQHLQVAILRRLVRVAARAQGSSLLRAGHLVGQRDGLRVADGLLVAGGERLAPDARNHDLSGLDHDRVGHGFLGGLAVRIGDLQQLPHHPVGVAFHDAVGGGVPLLVGLALHARLAGLAHHVELAPDAVVVGDVGDVGVSDGALALGLGLGSLAPLIQVAGGGELAGEVIQGLADGLVIVPALGVGVAGGVGAFRAVGHAQPPLPIPRDGFEVAIQRLLSRFLAQHLALPLFLSEDVFQLGFQLLDTLGEHFLGLAEFFGLEMLAVFVRDGAVFADHFEPEVHSVDL